MEASDESWGCEVKLAWNLTPCRAEASACGAEGQPRLHGVTLSISVLDIRSPKIACVHYLTSLLIEALVIISGQWPRCGPSALLCRLKDCVFSVQEGKGGLDGTMDM